MEQIKPLLRWVAVCVAAGAAVFAFITPHRSDPATAPDDSPPPAGAAALASPMPPAPEAVPSVLAVYVCGAIRNPAVYRLAPGSRVVDAVNKAGGLSREADAEAVNLAEPLVDGMKVDI